jgi:hypothetical protein
MMIYAIFNLAFSQCIFIIINLFFIIINLLICYLNSLAFYVMYDFGLNLKESQFSSPLQSIYDCITMSVHELLIAYENLLITKYKVVGKV